MLDEFRSTNITWDKATSRIYSPVTANASDENGRKLVVQIVNSGQVEDLTGATLHLYWETRDKAHDGLDVFKAVDLEKGEFELSYTTGMLSNHGVLNANLVLIDTVGRVVSERFKITVTEGIDDDAIQSENSFSSLTQALIDISNLEQNYAPRLNDLTAQLQQKPNYQEVRQDTATRPINVSEMDTETKQLFTGGAVAVVGENAIGTENLKDKVVTFDKLSDLNKESIGQLLYGKKLFQTFISEPSVGWAGQGRGWANRITYNQEIISAVKIFVPLVTFTGNLRATIRLGSDLNVIVAESSELPATHAGWYHFVFDEYVTPDVIAGDYLYLTVESVGLLDRIGETGSNQNVLSDRVDITNSYMLSSSGVFSKVSNSPLFGVAAEFLGPVNMDEKVDNDNEYKKIKETNSYMSAANELFNTQIELPNFLNNSPSAGWATVVSYEGERIVSAKIHVNLAITGTRIYSTIRKGSNIEDIVATSKTITVSESGIHTFEYDQEINANNYTEDDFYITLESENRTQAIFQPSNSNMETKLNRVVRDGRTRQKSTNGSWVVVSNSSAYALYATFANNDVTESLNKKQDKSTEKKVTGLVKFPKRVYSVYNDGSDRHFAPTLYTEMLANQYHELEFNNGLTRLPLIAAIPDTNTATQLKNVTFKKGSYHADPLTINQVVTKASVPNKKAFVLCIGDSLTQQKDFAYWKQATELFEKETIDFDRESNVVFVGAENRESVDVDYKGVQKTVVTGAEGRGGWTVIDYLRYSTVRRANQETWDILGLGDGSGTDYTGTTEQQDLIRNTTENNAAGNPWNRFFDNDKIGKSKFSINKWLERNRTMDDQGNRLTLGNGTGTMVTADTLNTMNVCKPTHVVLSFGHNDLSQYSVDSFFTYAQELIDEVRLQLPEAIIIYVLSPPRLGAWNKDRYPNFTNIRDPFGLDKYIANANKWIDYFDGKNEETEKLFLMDKFHTLPPVEGFEAREFTDAFGHKYYDVFGDSVHPGSVGHKSWGYQLYSLLKYTMTL